MYYVHKNCVPYREDAFDKFSAIKHVDALGACKNNNKGIRLAGTLSSNWKALAGYRFALCMENRKQSGYITEKILTAFVSGAIPVYYGTEEVFDIFNRNAFIYYDIDNPEQAIAQVKYLEENPDKYEQMLREPMLVDGAFEKYFAKESSSGRVDRHFLMTHRSLRGRLYVSPGSYSVWNCKVSWST